jgi:hypothetical protein
MSTVRVMLLLLSLVAAAPESEEIDSAGEEAPIEAVRVMVGATMVLVEGTGASMMLRLAEGLAAAVVGAEVAEVCVDEAVEDADELAALLDEDVVPDALEDVDAADDEPVAELVATLVDAAELATGSVLESVGMPAAPATGAGTIGSPSGNGERFFMRRFMFPWSRRWRGTSWASTAVARRRER